MPCLLDLSLEVLEMVVLQMESVEDVVSLGSSYTHLARVVGQDRIWRVLLDNTEFKVMTRTPERGEVMEDRMRAITTFLSSLENRDAIFSLLHQTIYECYPGTEHPHNEDANEDDNIKVSFPPCPQLHSVSSLGLQLLALTGRQEARHEVHEVIVTRLSSSLLLSLVSLKIESLSELWAGGSITCRTEEEGRALVSLLESCKEWSVGLDGGSSVGGLYLEGEVGGQTWEGLAREVARARELSRLWPGSGLQQGYSIGLGSVYTKREVVERGRRKDLLAVWKCTWYHFEVDEEKIEKSDGEKKGWKRIKQMTL